MTAFKERHAPKTISDLVIADQYTADTLSAFANGSSQNHILLHGPFGTGKSTTARIIAEQSLQDIPNAHPSFLHASQVTDVALNTLTGKLSRGWRTLVGIDHSVTIIDEIDQVEETNQQRLRGILDTYGDCESFILTTNKLHNVDGGICDRCDVVELPAIDPLAWRTRATQILRAEGIELDPVDLDELLKQGGSSIRSLMRLLEQQVLEVNRNAA